MSLELQFNQLSEYLFSQLKSGEDLNLNLDAEETNFLRFNQAKVRQTTFVDQKRLAMVYQGNQRRVNFYTMLSGNQEFDRTTTLALLERARAEAQILPADPFLVPMENRGQSSKNHKGKLLGAADATEIIVNAAAGNDFVGLYTGGPVIRANQNSKGQKHWFSTETFFIDYSLYTTNVDGDNKAVKSVYADTEWNSKIFSDRLQASKNQLSLMKRKTQVVKPGDYRVYLAPGAVADIGPIMSWNALSFSAMKQGNCAFTKLYDKERTLSPLFNLTENFTLGLTPQFNSLGEMAPEILPIIEKGVMKNMLVSSRSEKEYGVKANGAVYEGCRSPDFGAGDLAEVGALKALGTGLYLGNLHYLNWSEVANARITGMTRYAGFWVENGEIVGPIKDMRFDDSLFRIFGSELAAVTREQHIDPSTSTYMQRELAGQRVPGMLLNNMTFTL